MPLKNHGFGREYLRQQSLKWSRWGEGVETDFREADHLSHVIVNIAFINAHTGWAKKLYTCTVSQRIVQQCVPTKIVLSYVLMSRT